MANFSTNQVHQLYVASTVKTGADAVASAGDIKLFSVNNGAETELYFQYKGATGDVLRSDFIPVKNITSIVDKTGEALRTPLKKLEITCTGSPVTGQDYVLNINFKNFFSSGDDSQYYKSAAVHVTSAMHSTPSDFYKAMVKALNKAFSREDGATATSNPYLKFMIKTSGSPLEEGDANWASTAATALIILEKEPDWIQGTMPQRRVYFDVFFGTVIDSATEFYWGTQTDVTLTSTQAASSSDTTLFFGNGKKIADLEWFCLGERGDQYRGMGYPNTITTKYQVVPTNEYDVLTIHFAFTDTGVNSYRTEKELTIVAEKSTSVVSTLKTAINAYLTPTNASMAAAIAAS